MYKGSEKLGVRCQTGLFFSASPHFFIKKKEISTHISRIFHFFRTFVVS